MSQRFRVNNSFVALSLVLATGGAIAVACSSDDDPSTTEGQLTGNAGSAGSGATAVAGNGGASGAPATGAGAGTGGALAAGGSEGQSTDVPIDQQPEPPNGTAGVGGAAPTEPPPAGEGLVPNCDPAEGAVPNVALELVAGGLTEPLYVTGVPGDDTRLMILEKAGRVRVVLNGELQETPFIDVSADLINQQERGALGLAFHPNYAENGLFYLHWSSDGGDGLPGAGDTVVAEFQVDPNNRNLANPASRRIVLTIDQPNANHNGGELTFGVDGLLYLGFGDGGLGNDMGQGHAAIGNAQTLTTLLGKILRIDPTGRAINNAYSAPADNFAQVANQPTALPEIWSVGMRNPWRFSFDACNGDLYIGDVGQDAIEEVDFVAAAPETRTIAAGLNFGWRIMEGTQCGPVAAECTDQTRANLVLPVDTYTHQVGQSVTGGYVYRGSRVPGLRGQYVYADFQTKHVFRFRIQDGAIADRVEITDQFVAGGVNVAGIASFGTDNAGELYVSAFDPDGAVYRVIQAP